MAVCRGQRYGCCRGSGMVVVGSLRVMGGCPC